MGRDFKTVGKFKCYGTHKLSVRPGLGGEYLYSEEQIQEMYINADNLREIAKNLDISSRSVRNLLCLANVDYLADLYSEHGTDSTWDKIAKRHGMKRKTLTKLMKKNGYLIERGPRISKSKRNKIIDELKADGSTNSIAKECKVHWCTVQKLKDEN